MSPLAPNVPVRRTAHQREERRIRIMGMVRSGFSYEAIARDEQLSPERIRQIVVASLKTDEHGTRVDHKRVQMARLEPALRLAASSIEKGKLAAVNTLLRVLERLDKYSALAEAPALYDENAREKLLAKLDRAAERMGMSKTDPPAESPSDAVLDGGFEDKSLENADSGLEAS